MKNKNGFTLMELLIVVIIIAGFAGFAYPTYVESIERARASEAVQMLGTIQAAQQKHFVNYETYGANFIDINDFAPGIEGFNPNSADFNTKYFHYVLREDRVTADRIVAGKGYSFVARYNEQFVRCVCENTKGEKICSSLTDKDQMTAGQTKYYPIF